MSFIFERRCESFLWRAKPAGDAQADEEDPLR